MLERWLREPVEELETCLSIVCGRLSSRFMASGFVLCGCGEAMVRAGGTIVLELI